uniref:Putative mitochondrial carrier PB17E12.12c n=1 Tax=Lygus hesperus TaxID=30085 RepID=A0A0A9WQU2_LYGHE
MHWKGINSAHEELSPHTSAKNNESSDAYSASTLPAAAVTNVARHVEENYNKMLDTVSLPNYRTIKTLLSHAYNTEDGYGKSSDSNTSDIIPGIQVSFELFETVQNRFALTRQNL